MVTNRDIATDEPMKFERLLQPIISVSVKDNAHSFLSAFLVCVFFN